jgi:hypothetical protein
MAVQNNDPAAGADVVQSTCDGAAGQRWLLRLISGDIFELLPQTGSNLCLDVSGRSTANGADVIQWTCNSQPNQRFRIAP